MKTVAIAGIAENVKNYVAAVTATGMTPVVTRDRSEAVACDGLILPGGGDVDPALYHRPNLGSMEIDRPLDEDQLAILDLFVRGGKPVLGICKGHQVINVYFGGTLIQDIATAKDHRYNDALQADNIHPVANLPGYIPHALYGPRMIANSTHHQALETVAPGLRAVAFAPDGVVEAAVHDTLPILGVQWHPERMCYEKARPDTDDGAAIFQWLKNML